MHSDQVLPRCVARRHRGAQKSSPVPGQYAFVIEQLLELREVRGQVQVLVKWMGFDKGENTWEPVALILEDAPDLLREFLEITSSALASKVRAML
jgi:Chromo (CHRromatin Organisation MOdifier) domain